VPNFAGTQDVRSYLLMMWRWKLLIAFFVLVPPLAAYLVELGKPNVYQSSTLVGINQTTVNTGLLNSSASFTTSNVVAIADLVRTSPVANRAARLLHPPANPSQLVDQVTATGDTTTNFVQITGQDRSPVRAAKIANAFAKAISQDLQQSAISQIDSASAGIRSQLRALPPNDPNRPGLQQQLEQLLASRSAQGNEAIILQPADPSSTPAGPHVRRTVELALLIGILLAFGAVMLAESADRRIRTPEDLERMTELPLLAAIGSSAFSGRLETSREDDEAFHMLRTALTYFNVEQLDSVLITSPGEKDGKTTVATRLALVTAQAGQRVVLVDADLRRAQVSVRLGLHPRKVGLGAVLAKQAALEDVLVDYDLAGSAQNGGQLTVVPAGPTPPNPSALISSDRMRHLLTELESQSDLVIIDTPAALAVSDPIALVPNVSGVVVVARTNRSSRQRIRRLQRMITAAHGNLLGVVATGVTATQGYYEHYATKYYAHNGSSNGHHGGRHLLRRRKHPAAEADAQHHD
jgi:polysaccharide biosynthesis transport protein